MRPSAWVRYLGRPYPGNGSSRDAAVSAFARQRTGGSPCQANSDQRLGDVFAVAVAPDRRHPDDGRVGHRLLSLSDNIDTTTAGGRLYFHMLGAVAEFERDLIRERTQAGMNAARA
jgi:hypothetical protein